METLKRWCNQLLLLLLIIGFGSLKAQIYNEFTNTDSIRCVDFSYPVYYHFEKDTLIDGYRANKFVMGEDPEKSTYFWIGEKNKKLYSLQIDINQKLKKVGQINFESDAETNFYIGSKKSIKIKFLKFTEFKGQSDYFYSFRVIKAKGLLRYFSKSYQLRNLMIHPKEGIIFDFDYTDDNHSTIWEKCYKL